MLSICSLHGVIYSPLHCPVGLQSDSASLVEVHWSLVKMSRVWSFSGQSLLKSENNWNSLSSDMLIVCIDTGACNFSNLPPINITEIMSILLATAES